MRCKRSYEIDLQIQSILLDSHQPTGDESVEMVDPQAVGIMVNLTQKPVSEAIVLLGVLVRKYRNMKRESLVPEIDELIEMARIRAERSE